VADIYLNQAMLRREFVVEKFTDIRSKIIPIFEKFKLRAFAELAE